MLIIDFLGLGNAAKITAYVEVKAADVMWFGKVDDWILTKIDWIWHITLVALLCCSLKLGSSPFHLEVTITLFKFRNFF